ncbi:uncharacterized protein LAJ45_04081 [Morchella importuna]|uniref:uncharacterized protein n=1 Tax=Morchella importuna TaxID=1174673 RepID=UPI001E8E478F|nr:uncharacterized protein LAJ45_04081 [Morchella importuna]KAH8152087.1 hypothetical protein LAJ45_04081 [Morchella importuna]
MATPKVLLAAILLCFVLLSLIAPSSAHMVMSDPPPINYKDNPFYLESKGDFDYTAPISPSGSNYPCRGHLDDLDTPQGGSVKTWAAGSTQTLTIAGSAVHGGGSCQAALSYDKGTTWIVIKSWIGNCPHATPGGDQTFKFPIPSSAPAGEKVLFAWTWFNNVGNREMYMNCAVVTITGGSSNALSGPTLFLANIGNGCTTASGTDVVFPNPGDTVEYGGSEGDRAPPSGSCGSGGTGTASGSGSGTGSSSGSGSGSGTGSGTGSGSSSSGTGTNTGNGQGCEYWRTQGYVCSDASPSLIGKFTFMNIAFGFLAFSWITLRVF